MKESIFPKKGFYVHYKHDPQGAPYNYTYEVIGVAKDTEDGSLSVLYRPLYENDWIAPADFFSRPLEMFVESLERDGRLIQRFERVQDPELTQACEKQKVKVYGA